MSQCRKIGPSRVATFRRRTCLRGTPFFCRSRWDGPKSSAPATSSLASMPSITRAIPIAVPSSSRRSSDWPRWRPQNVCRAVRCGFTRPSRRSPRPRSSEKGRPCGSITALHTAAMTRIRTATHAAAATVAHSVRLALPRPVWRTPYSTDKVRKMRSFWSFSLQRQLAVAIGLLLVPVLAAAVWSGTSTFRERATELGDQAHLLAHTTAAYINRDLSYLHSTGAGLQSHPNVQALSPALSEDLF